MSALYLALGDSLTAGYGVRPGLGFAERYARILRQRGSPLQLVNGGVNGLTVNGLSLFLQQPLWAAKTVQASLITITIGSNDFLNYGRSLLQGVNSHPLATETFLLRFSAQLNLLGQDLRRLNPRAAVQVANLYNPLAAGPYASFVDPAQVLLNQANKILGHWGKKYGLEIIRIDRVFRGKEKSLLGPDSIHPNALGYEAMAFAFAH